ncbi:exodeoxyribonuclease VII small subunit [Christensenellaceae bacterium OttesenSCG-928-L17]|nr:exodeoxyribonuclease VII small subunit [Christensenellaceae bacterium OttesenSCG-928-L17]
MNELQDMTFEQAMKELEEIIAKLELANSPLSEMVALYERGAKLGEHCLRILETYQGKLETIQLEMTPEGEG